MCTELTISNINSQNDFECKDLSYRTIQNIDFEAISHKTSFYRSDFRGSKFESIKFSENNLDLADFIGNTFKNVEFHSVIFGKAEFKNDLFYHCQFEENNYDDIAIHNCTFKNCIFQNEQFRLTMNDCTFINCQFIDCIFDQCSTDTLSFDKCVFLKCELSTMHAENFKFENCTFRDAFLGICFLGTYLFKNTDINLISFKYRGRIVETTHSDYFDDFMVSLKNQGRYFEYFNLSLLWNKCDDSSNVGLKDLLDGVVKEANPNVRDYNLKGLFEAIEFYAGTNTLPMYRLFDYISVLQNFPISSVPAESQLMFLQNIYRLNSLISSLDYSFEYITSISESTPCIATFHCMDESRKSAEENITKLLDEVNSTCFNKAFSKPYFDVISYREGSVFLTIASSLLLILMAAKVIRSVYELVCEIRIETAKTNKTIEMISSSKTPTSLNKAISCITPTTDSISPEKIHKIFSKDYLQDLLINFFLK